MADAGFRGVVVVIGRGMRRTRLKGECIVEVEAGCELAALIGHSLESGLTGLEDLAGIPGSVGGAAFMNAGALGTSFGDRVKELRVLRIAPGEVKEIALTRKKAAFGYRVAHGVGSGDIIYEVMLELEKGDVERARERYKEAVAWRRREQPLSQPSAGSVFLNPEGGYAGELIEKCGLKGLRVGDAMVSFKHANFIVNVGSATASDVLALIEKVKEEVLRREGVELREEIRMAGFS